MENSQMERLRQAIRRLGLSSPPTHDIGRMERLLMSPGTAGRWSEILEGPFEVKLGGSIYYSQGPMATRKR